MTSIPTLFDNNKKWAAEVEKNNPDFFTNLAREQTPDHLWIGCSDSRVPPNRILDLEPGEIFVHRNISNLIVEHDINCLSVLQYAVEVLEVKNIIICGHYGCGGIKAALDDEAKGPIGNWLQHIQKMIQFHEQKIEGLDAEKKVDMLCELNVLEQVTNVCNTSIVKKAWKNGAEFAVNGWIYDLKKGTINELYGGIDSLQELENMRKKMF